MSAESQEVRELAADLPTAPEHEPIAHLAAVAENTDRGEQDALIRTPAGRLVPSIPPGRAHRGRHPAFPAA